MVHNLSASWLRKGTYDLSGNRHAKLPMQVRRVPGVQRSTSYLRPTVSFQFQTAICQMLVDWVDVKTGTVKTTSISRRTSEHTVRCCEASLQLEPESSKKSLFGFQFLSYFNLTCWVCRRIWSHLKATREGIRLAKLPAAAFFVLFPVQWFQNLNLYLDFFNVLWNGWWTPSTMAHMLWKFLQADALVNCILAKVSHCHLAKSPTDFFTIDEAVVFGIFWETLSHKQCEACTYIYICISVMNIYLCNPALYNTYNAHTQIFVEEL